ncbi:hypothetical protein CWI75_12285 [Kineobactrum sediminis]|uniref:AlpA family transcriptional regulator n=1 Tax=Kineobactrum sediminis TaxID=1905677 RepID=A0A2N5Y2A2_9GAMM|nr:hypothetical protein CWI75_12285 [Kineobactrum sediminis]
MHSHQQDRLLRWPEVQSMTGISRTTAWRLEKRCQFPRSLQISTRTVAWRATDIQAFIASRQPAGGNK